MPLSQSPVAGCFKPGQFGAKVDNLELVKDLQTELFAVVGSEDCHFELTPGNDHSRSRTDIESS